MRFICQQDAGEEGREAGAEAGAPRNVDTGRPVQPFPVAKVSHFRFGNVDAQVKKARKKEQKLARRAAREAKVPGAAAAAVDAEPAQQQVGEHPFIDEPNHALPHVLRMRTILLPTPGT